MAVIDDKVVAMSFESSKFESGVNKTLSSLDKLKKSLDFTAANKSFAGIGTAAKQVDLGHIAKGIDNIHAKLGAFSVAALAIFATVAKNAVAAGATFVKAFTLDPIKLGFKEYATNLNAVQTILANTQAAGVGIKKVNQTLKELNEYSDRTIYNFSQMARNIGTFTAAGVEIDTATASIKGIANLAALSGSNAEQAATAMYQLSQAISAGRVSLMDWNSVVNAGMGGTVFQRALAQTAEQMGTLKKGTVDLVGPMKNVSINGESFRSSLAAGTGKDSWLTSEVLTSTLKQFTGDLKDAELAAMGFNAEQIKAIQQTAKTAMHAATEVKTLDQVLQVAKETAGSGWAQTWQIIFGDFAEAKKTFTELSNTINGFINTNADARNKVLGDWKKLGGRTELINAIRIAFHNLSAVVKPIKEAFKDIFPPVTGKTLYNLTLQFKEFTKMLKPSPETINYLRRTFRGLFAVLDIGKQIIGGIFIVFGRLFGALDGAGGGFLSITARIGDFLVSVDEALKKGDRLNKFFEKVGDALAVPIKLLGELKDALSTTFGGFSSGGVTGGMSTIEKILVQISELWAKILGQMGEAGRIIEPLFNAYVSFMQSIGEAIIKAFVNMNFDAVLQVVRTGLFAGIFLMFRKFLGKGSLLDQISKGFAGGILSNISRSFGALTGSMNALQGSLFAMQQNIKAKTLKEIALAVLLLAAGVLAISLVDPKKLSSSLAAITVMFGQLIGAMALLDKVTKTAGFIRLPIMAAGLILLAGSIDVLVLAVLALSRLDLADLAKGLGGVGALLGMITVAAGPLGKSSAGLVRAGVGITAIAVALRILANAVKAFGEMSLTELGKGLVSVATGLGVMVAAMTKMPVKGMMASGAALILIASGIRILANAVEKFGNMDWRTIGKGLLAVAGSLLIIGVAMRVMPKGMILQAGALLLVALALQGIARAVGIMGGMSVAEIARGLATLAISLTLLQLALMAMQGAIGGAIALTIAAAGIALLVPALVALGGLSWKQILTALIALAGALTVIGVAGLLIAPVVVPLLGLGAALLLIGAGLALAGAGLFLVGTGLAALVVALPTGVGVLIAALTEFYEAIPRIIKQTILGLLEIVKAFSAIAPQFVTALSKILDSLLDVVIKSSPKIVKAFEVLLLAVIDFLDRNQDKIIQAGIDIIIALLAGIKKNIGEIATLVIDIIDELLTAIAKNISKIISGGSKILIAIVKGIGDNYAKVAAAALGVITSFLTAIANNLWKVAAAGLSIVTKFLSAIASGLGKVIKAGTDVIVAYITGMGNAGPRLVAAATNMIIKFINALSKNAVKLADAGAVAIINFLNGIARVIETREPEMIAAGGRIGRAIVKGMVIGLVAWAPEVYNKAKEIGGKVLGFLGKAVGVKSPSEETYKMGQFLIEGLANGLSEDEKAMKAANDLGNGVIQSFKTLFQITSPSQVMHDIGLMVGHGFAQGLKGSAGDISSSFAELNNLLSDAMADAQATIIEEQAKLDELWKAKKKDRDLGAIREAQKVIKENENILARSTAGHKTLTKALRDEKNELMSLAKEFDKVSERLKKAEEKLEEVKKTRDDALKGFKEQYAGKPEISEALTEEIKDARSAIAREQDKLDKLLAAQKQDPDAIVAANAAVAEAQAQFDNLVAGKVLNAEGTAVDQLATYIQALKNQTDAVSAYQSTLDQLRKLGLDDATYQKLLEEGTADQQFASQLLAGGKTAVQSLNTLDSNLMKVSTTLATNAAKNLYQAGVDAAEGLVKGLKDKQSDIRKTMETIAKEMIRALKKELKIKSPSEVFAEIGKFSMEGMAQGFSDSSKIVTDAADQAAQDALTAMQKSMRNISSVVTDELNPNPVITPILDLTQVQSKAAELARLTNVVPITAANSFGQASAISAEQARILAQAEESAVAGGPSVKFEQNNYSPEALTEVEIYRQTRNQLSQLKSALSLT